MGQVEVDVEGGQVLHQAAIRAVPEKNAKSLMRTLRDFIHTNLKYNMASIESSKSSPGAYTATDIGPLHLQGVHRHHGHLHAQFGLPLQQRFEVVKKCEVPMSGVGYGFITIKLFPCSDIVVEDPILASHALAEGDGFVEAFNSVRYDERIPRYEANRLRITI